MAPKKCLKKLFQNRIFVGLSNKNGMFDVKLTYFQYLNCCTDVFTEDVLIPRIISPAFNIELMGTKSELCNAPSNCWVTNV